MRLTRPISWVAGAWKEFQDFPDGARDACLVALNVAAEGGKADIAKPLSGLGSGVLEVALRFGGNAYRVVYALSVGPELWVVHVFVKKSSRGMKTPGKEINVIRSRLKRIRENGA